MNNRHRHVPLSRIAAVPVYCSHLDLVIPQLPPFSVVSGEGAEQTVGCPGVPRMEQVLADEGGSPCPSRILSHGVLFGYCLLHFQCAYNIYRNFWSIVVFARIPKFGPVVG